MKSVKMKGSEHLSPQGEGEDGDVEGLKPKGKLVTPNRLDLEISHCLLAIGWRVERLVSLFAFFPLLRAVLKEICSLGEALLVPLVERRRV